MRHHGLRILAEIHADTALHRLGVIVDPDQFIQGKPDIQGWRRKQRLIFNQKEEIPIMLLALVLPLKFIGRIFVSQDCILRELIIHL